MAYGYHICWRVINVEWLIAWLLDVDTHGDVRELRRFVRLLDRRLDEAVPAELCSLCPAL